MKQVPNAEELSNFDLREFKIPILEKYTDNRGYMYILYDKIFPDYIKVGRTSDLYKRQCQYNADKPFKTAKMIYISVMFEDAKDIERRILSYMYDNTPPTTLSKEWFEIQHKEKILFIIEKAELGEIERLNS